jgi:hypothetical protein
MIPTAGEGFFIFPRSSLAAEPFSQKSLCHNSVMGTRFGADGAVLRPARGGFRKFLLVAALLGGVLFLLIWLLDMYAVSPWAYSRGGRPTLTGTWVGTFRTSGGIRGALLLDLQHTIGDWNRSRRGFFGRSHLRGEQQWCFAQGEQDKYPVEGLSNPAATNVTIFFQWSRYKPQGVLFFFNLDGAWASDVLNLSGKPTLTPRYHNFDAAVANAKAPTQIQLRHGTQQDFQQVCQQLR